MLILILINAHYLQKAAFSFEQGLNGQNYSPSDLHHSIKNTPGKFPTPPAPNTIWKTVLFIHYILLSKKILHITKTTSQNEKNASQFWLWQAKSLTALSIFVVK